MERLKNFWKSLTRDRKGLALIEYALIAALVSVVAIAALTLVGGNVQNKFNNVGNSIS